MKIENNLYFLGLTTGESFSIKMFPHWVKNLGIQNANLLGVDMNIRDTPQRYREFIERLIRDDNCRGAVITTHKLDLYNAANDMFHQVDSFAESLQEVSCIVKREGKLFASAIDPLSSKQAMDRFLTKDYFGIHGGEVLIFGAGGSALAICCALCDRERDLPSKIIITNRSLPRLEEAQRKLKRYEDNTLFEYHLASESNENDKLLAKLRPYSLIVNATGLGKDRPGSPISDDVKFPCNTTAWDLNYRGDLGFLRQAKQQEMEQKLSVQDGWDYFVIAWAMVVSMVYNIDIDDKKTERLSQMAAEIRKSISCL